MDQHVRRSGKDYAFAMSALLPSGMAWPRDRSSLLMKLVSGLAEVWGYVDGRAADLLEIESDPAATIDLLPDWERNYGLPDPCARNEHLTINQRHINLVKRITLIGAQDRLFFIQIAKDFEYEVKIREYAPYATGISHCGWTKGYNEDDPEHVRWELGPPTIRFYWTVRVFALRYDYFRTGSGECGVDPLLFISTAADLECIIHRLKPAHTYVVFDYSYIIGLDYSRAFNSGYLVMGII